MTRTRIANKKLKKWVDSIEGEEWFYCCYRGQKSNAKSRGIPFLLSFEEWIDIWKESGHWSERGPRKGQFVMGRLLDKGGYEKGNVVIITNHHNAREAIYRRARLSSPSFLAWPVLGKKLGST
jgi:hypothetical protein